MKIELWIDGKIPAKYEVYKVQLSLFGVHSCLIYNEDRDEMWETTDKNEINEISKFVKGQVKCFAAGRLNNKGQIILEKLLPNKTEYQF